MFYLNILIHNCRSWLIEWYGFYYSNKAILNEAVNDLKVVELQKIKDMFEVL